MPVVKNVEFLGGGDSHQDLHPGENCQEQPLVYHNNIPQPGFDGFSELGIRFNSIV